MLKESDFDTYIRTPFAVKAVKITEENIEDFAVTLGEIRIKNEQKYIALNPEVVPNIEWAYINWWVTVFEGNVRVYSPKVFKEQFIRMPENFEVQTSFHFSN